MQRASEGSFSMCLRKRPFNIWWIDQHFFGQFLFFFNIWQLGSPYLESRAMDVVKYALEDTWKTFRLDSQDSLHCLQELFSLSLFWLSVFKIRTPNQLHVENVFLCIQQNQFKYCKKSTNFLWILFEKWYKFANLLHSKILLCSADLEFWF